MELAGRRGRHDAAPGDKTDKTVADLHSDDPRTRAAAADALGMLGPAAGEHAGALTSLLHDGHEAVSLNAAYALAAIGPDAVNSLVDALAGDDPSASAHAAFALATLEDRAVGPLIDAVKSPSTTTRRHAAIALGNISRSGEQLVAALGGAASDDDRAVRFCAIESLGQHGPAAQAAVGQLIEALGDYEVAGAAALALCRIGPAAAEAVPALARCLYDHENRYLPGFGVEALHRIGSDEAMDVLVPYLKSTRFCPVSLDPAHPY